jgi:hypothetical protein
MSCQIDMSNSNKSYFTPEQKTFYSVLFKDNTYAYVTKETLTDIMNSRLDSIENIVKFNYEKEFDLHFEITLFSEQMVASGNEYIKTYESLPQMYGSNPLTDFDKNVILKMNKNT